MGGRKGTRGCRVRKTSGREAETLGCAQGVGVGVPRMRQEVL